MADAPKLPTPSPFAQVTPYGITNVGAPSAHSYTTGYGVKVLIMDTGTDIYHGDLYSRTAFRCVNSAYPSVDDMGHGTHVTGIAAALNNSSDVIGVAPDLYLMSSNVFIGVASIPAEVACSIDVARLNSVSVANMSFSLSTSTAVTDEINGGYNYDNMLFVGAAGNESSNAVVYPASLSNVIAVSAVDSTNTFASFSNRNSKIEMTAPGVNVLSTAWTGGYVCANGTATALCSGTSMAAPHVSGALALITAYNPTWTNAQVRSRLTSTAYDLGLYGRDIYYGFGLVNLASAIP